MKKLLIFDLKDTLVYPGDRLCADCKQIMTLAKLQGFDLLLYSMNEPWTYKVLDAYSDVFSDFQSVLLTIRKKNEDVQFVTVPYDIVLMIGDGQEEQRIAKDLDYPFLLVRDELAKGTYSKWLEGLGI